MVVLSVEERDFRRHVVADLVADVADQPLLPRKADDRGEECLGHAVRHVHAAGLSPFGYVIAAAHDHAGDWAAFLHGPDDRAERLGRAERLRLRERLVARIGCFAGDGELDRLVERGGVETQIPWGAWLPVEAIGVVGLRRRDRYEHGHPYNEARDPVDQMTSCSQAVRNVQVAGDEYHLLSVCKNHDCYDTNIILFMRRIADGLRQGAFSGATQSLRACRLHPSRPHRVTYRSGK